MFILLNFIWHSISFQIGKISFLYRITNFFLSKVYVLFDFYNKFLEKVEFLFKKGNFLSLKNEFFIQQIEKNQFEFIFFGWKIYFFPFLSRNYYSISIFEKKISFVRFYLLLFKKKYRFNLSRSNAKMSKSNLRKKIVFFH